MEDTCKEMPKTCELGSRILITTRNNVLANDCHAQIPDTSTNTKNYPINIPGTWSA